MATSDRDIIITPNTSTSNDPKIEFKGGGTAAGSASTITMVALAKTAHEGVVQFQATDGDTIAAFSEYNSGSLFSITSDDGKTRLLVSIEWLPCFSLSPSLTLVTSRFLRLVFRFVITFFPSDVYNSFTNKSSSSYEYLLS